MSQLDMFPPSDVVYLPCTALKPCLRLTCSLCRRS